MNTPDTEAEYIFNHNYAYTEDDGKVIVKQGTIVKVRPGVRYGYIFNTTKDPDTDYTCQYGWAFVLDTPENREVYMEYVRAEIAIKVAKEEMKKLFGKIIHLGKDDVEDEEEK